MRRLFGAIRNLNARASSGAVELAKDVESGDEGDEADAHDENSGGSDLQARRFIRAEPEHVAPRSGATSRAAKSATEPAAANAGCCHC